MKLHLPKGLRKAVMACMAALTTLSTTVGTGIIAGGAVTVALYIGVSPQAQAGWGADGQTGGHIYWYEDASTELTAPTDSSQVANSGYATASDAYTNLFLCSENVNNSVTLSKLSGGDGVSFSLAANPWHSDKNFTELTIDLLEYGSGTGAGVINNANSKSALTVKAVSGSLSGVNNVGTMTLGEASGIINLAGTIANSGTMTLKGTFNIADVSDLERHSGGYTDGANGFAIYNGYSVLEGSNIDTSAATFTLNGEATVLNAGGWISGDTEIGDIYYLNDAASVYEATNGDELKISSAGGSITVNGDANTKVKLVSLELTANKETILQTSGGATLENMQLGQFSIDNTGRTLTVGEGVRLGFFGTTLSSEQFAISMGNGTLNISGGYVVADSLIMQNYYTNKDSTINIADGGYLEITGAENGGYKVGCIRLGHWSGTAGAINVTDGEFRALNATVGMGDDGYGNLRVSGNGVANLKGITCLRTAEQLNVTAGGKLNIGSGGISQYGGYWGNAHPGVINVDNATLGALAAEGWFSSAQTNIGNGTIIQLSAYQVDTGAYDGEATTITLSGAHAGTGALVLAGDGRLVISSALLNEVSVAEGSGATLAINGLDGFVVESVSGLSGYGTSTTDGYAAGESYRITGTGSTIDAVTLLTTTVDEDGNETTTETQGALVDGLFTISVEDNTTFYVNTEVDRALIDTVKEGTNYALASGAVYRTSVVEDLGVITSVEDETAKVVLQSAEGKNLLEITNVTPNWQPNITIEGDSVVCSASAYKADFTVLSGATLTQTGNDMAGEGYDAITTRTITVQDGGTFDIGGYEAYYHIVLEEGATLSNSGAAVTSGGRNLALVELEGDATVTTNTRLGVVFSGYNASELHLNGHTLTKTGTGYFHLNNCTLDAGTIRIEEGYVTLLEYNGPQYTNADAATFEVCANEDGTVVGGLEFGAEGRKVGTLNNLIASGGEVWILNDRVVTLNNVSGSAFSKRGAGTLSFASGIKIQDNLSITSAGGTLTLAALNVAEGKVLSIVASDGIVQANGLGNSGAGMLTINSLAGGTISYLSAADKLQIASLTDATVIDILGISDLSNGVNLGIAYNDENLAKLVVSAVEEGSYELINDNGYIKLQGVDGASPVVDTNWDINWGAAGLANAPSALTEAKITVFNTDGTGLSETGYLVDGQVAVKLIDPGVSDVSGGPDYPWAICGAAYDAPQTEASTVTIEKGVWIEAASGRYGAIVGGSLAGNWNGSGVSEVNADSHILINHDSTGGSLFIRNVIGGNMGESAVTNAFAKYTGNTYVSVLTNNVGIGVTGGSVSFHGGATELTGNTNVFVYTSLTNSGSKYREELHAVVGGMMSGDNHAMKQTMTGNATVLIDLTGSASAVDFAKAVIGGNVGSTGTSANNSDPAISILDGKATLTIKGTNADGNDIKFAEYVVGGTYAKGGTNTTGAAALNITGGSYAKYVVGGVLQISAATSTIGNTDVMISDASFDNWVTGGTFTNSSNSVVTQRDVTMTLTDSSFKKVVVGGTFVGGYNTTSNVGNVSIKLDGVSLAENVYGGAYHYSTAGAATTTVGNVTVELTGDGAVTGNIYAAGGSRHTTANMTVASTTVKVGSSVILNPATIISAGFDVPVGSSPNVAVTGDRTILFTGDADQDRSGVYFLGFNKIGVETSGKTATIGGAALAIEDAFCVIGNGTIKLAAGTPLSMAGGATIESTATVDLNGNAVTGDVTNKGTLVAIGGGAVNGSLTLVAGSTLTLWDGTDAATNGVLDMTVPAGEGISLLTTGNGLTMEGLFNVNVGIDLGSLTEVDLITGFDADSLSISGITLDSENKVQAAGMMLNGKEVSESDNLWLVVDGDTLKLSTIAGLEDFYWEGGDGNWTDAGWAMEDGGADLVNIKDAATREDDVNAIFSGSSATITVDTTATVDDMSVTITGGDYTFVAADDSASLDITGTLTVDSGAQADIQMDASAGSVVITDAGSSLSVETLTIGDGGLTMDAGNLSADKLTGSGVVTITGGTVELTNGSDAAGGTGISDAEFVGTSTLADATVGDVTVDGAGSLNLSDSTLTGQINAEAGAMVTIGGAMHLDTTKASFELNNQSTFAATAGTDDSGSLDGDGFITTKEIYTVVTGDTANLSSDADWTVGADNKVASYGIDGAGTVTIAEDKVLSAYWINNDDVVLSDIADNFVDETTTIKLNGGSLSMDTDTDKAIVTNNENPKGTDSRIALSGDGTTLDMDHVTISDGTTLTVTGTNDTIIDLGSEPSADVNLKGLDDASAWLGTVTTASTNVADVASLGNASSSVELSAGINTTDMNLGTVGLVDITGDLTADSVSVDPASSGVLQVSGLTTLKSGSSLLNSASLDGGLRIGGDDKATLIVTDLSASSVDIVNGDLTVDSMEVSGLTTVGSESQSYLRVTGDSDLTGGIALDNASTVEVKGALNLGGSAIKVNDLDSSFTIGSLIDDSVNFELDTNLLKEAADAGKEVTLLTTATDHSDVSITINGGSNVLNVFGEKYAYVLGWNEDGTELGVESTENENYMKEKYSTSEPNAIAGATLMDEAFASDAIGAGGDLEKILGAVDNGTMTDEHMAAVAGSSTAALGMAFAGDVERQLRAIRNRTTTMGVNQCVVNEGMPYFNAWVNAEGNLGELDQDGTYAGYQLDSWGGTIGFDVDVNPNLTLGLAVTAMYGDLTVDGPDMLEGDMDTYYVTAFARYSKRAWTHTFIGTIGKMDGSYERTVNHAGGSYKTEGDTDGMAFGLMYEVGRVYALTEDGDACLQPVFNIAYRHTTVGGYTEEGGDAALDVDDQTLDTITLGAGARMQAVVGENLYNRTSVLELRALAKLDVGDRASEADVAFIGGSSATVESAELGAFGVELGAGLSIPVGDENDGTIFFDVSAELRSGYSNVNGTVGYRINF